MTSHQNNRIEGASPHQAHAQAVWEFQKDNEIWFAGKFIFAVEFRPNIHRAERRKAMVALERLLNASNMGPDMMMGKAG